MPTLQINVYTDGPTGHSNISFLPEGASDQRITVGATVDRIGIDMITSEGGGDCG